MPKIPSTPRVPQSSHAPNAETARRPNRSAGEGTTPCARVRAEKQHPYLPPRKHHMLGQRLNGTVTLRNGEKDSDGAVAPACRHIAQAYHEFQGSKGEFLDLATRHADTIRDYFATRLDRLNRANLEQVRMTPEHHKHLVDGTQLGTYLDSVAAALQHTLPPEDGAESQADIRLFTTDHDMAAQVQLKRDEGGGVRLCVSVFDPNVASAHKRVEADAADNTRPIAALQLKDLLTDGRDYPGIDGHTRLCALSTDVRLEAGQTDFAEPPDAGTLPSPALMGVALSAGMASTVMALGARLPLARGPTERMALLQALDGRGFPGFHHAMQDDHAETVEAFGIVSGRSGLPASRRMDLLQACNPNTGTPALFIGAATGCTASVRAFIDIVLTGRFDTNQTERLLTGCTPENRTALTAAAVKHRPQVIDALMEGFERAKLNPGQLMRMLTHCPPHGAPPLHEAMARGNADSVRAFTAGLAKLPLDAKHKGDVLAAWNSDDSTGLSVAARLGHAEVVDAFGEAVETLEVDPVRVLRWLGVDPSTGQSALRNDTPDGPARAALDRIIARQQSRLQDAAGA